MYYRPVEGSRIISTALTAEEPGSSFVHAGNVKRSAGISLTSKPASHDFRNSLSRSGHLVTKRESKTKGSARCHERIETVKPAGAMPTQWREGARGLGFDAERNIGACSTSGTR